MIRCFHVAAPLERDSGRLDRRVCNEVSVDKSGEEARPVAYPGSLGVLRVIYNAAMTGIADLVYPVCDGATLLKAVRAWSSV